MADKITKFLAYDGKISITCIKTTDVVEEARKIHDLSPVATAAFGRLLTITLLMGEEMKGNGDNVTVQVKGNGPIGTMLAVSNNIPEVRGYVQNPNIDLPLNEFGKLDVGGAVGNEGYIHVIKDMGLKEPYIGVSNLTSGEIADDFTNYFVNSEQRQAAVALGVLVDKKGVREAGGYLITPMPDATDEEISKVEKGIFEAGAISKMLDDNLSLSEIAKKVTGDKNIKVIEDNKVPKYKCNCSKEKMAEALISIGKKELEDIIREDEKAELVCHFCNKKYNFTKEELEEILRKMGDNN